jgi:hypothetical protein
MFLSPKVQGGPKPMAGTFGGFNDMNRTNMLYRDIGLQYKLNGTGRDTYIWSNNGGFSQKFYETNNYDKPGTMLPKINRRSPEKKPYIHSKPPAYRQDGSGRDTYI